MMTDDLGLVLEIAGGLSATALAFIVSPCASAALLTHVPWKKLIIQFPAGAYASLTRGEWYSRQKLPAVACAVFGVVVLVLNCGLTVAKAFEPSKGDGGVNTGES
jgi:sodium-coupled neutral amino acid transporter 11